ncbi:helix-turn-helix transcriptional regulator [Geopseudomonas aromaticivorans]
MFACDEGHSICLTFVRRAYAVKGKAVNTQVDGECRPDSVLRMRKVVDRLGISRSTIYDWMNPKLRIPHHPATQSTLIWPGIPRPSGHLFHGHPAGQSERSDAGVALLVRVGWRRQFLRPFAH